MRRGLGRLTAPVRRHVSPATVMVAAVLLLAIAAGAYASNLVGSNGVIHGCTGKKGGPLDVVKAGKKCPKHDVSLAFDQKGPKGSTGTPGARGATGATGVTGPQGPGANEFEVSNEAEGTTSAPFGSPSMELACPLKAIGHVYAQLLMVAPDSFSSNYGVDSLAGGSSGAATDQVDGYGSGAASVVADTYFGGVLYDNAVGTTLIYGASGGGTVSFSIHADDTECSAQVVTTPASAGSS